MKKRSGQRALAPGAGGAPALRCAIYTRVSTDEQARSEYSSLDRQQEICRKYIDIQAEKGWVVAGVYDDPGYSGKDFNRPGIRELLEDVRAGRVNVVVTYKIDRISRSLRDFYDFWEVLQAHNATFVSATQQFDTSNPTGMLMLNILLSFAQFERELTRERTISKMLGRAEKGLWHGGHVPLGFTYDKETKLLGASDGELPIIRHVFARIAETRSPSTVANELNARGYRTRRRTITTRSGEQKDVGGARFDEDSVTGIVRNPVYKGCIRFNGTVYAGVHQPLVDAETWEAANAALGPRQEGVDVVFADPHHHLLKGILKCERCGLTMTPYRPGKKRPDGTPYLYYACYTVIQDGRHSPCPVRLVPARAFEEAVKGALAALGSSPAILRACIEAADRGAGDSVAALEQEQQRHRDEIGRLTAGIRRLIDVMKDEDLLSADLRDEYRRLVAEKERLQLLVATQQADIDRRRSRVLDEDIIRRSLEDFTRLVDALPIEDQKELVQLLLKEVTVAPLEEPGDAGTASEANDQWSHANTGTIETKIRARCYRARITLHQVQGLALTPKGPSSRFGVLGSHRRWGLFEPRNVLARSHAHGRVVRDGGSTLVPPQARSSPSGPRMRRSPGHGRARTAALCARRRPRRLLDHASARPRATRAVTDEDRRPARILPALPSAASPHRRTWPPSTAPPCESPAPSAAPSRRNRSGGRAWRASLGLPRGAGRGSRDIRREARAAGRLPCFLSSSSGEGRETLRASPGPVRQVCASGPRETSPSPVARSVRQVAQLVR